MDVHDIPDHADSVSDQSTEQPLEEIILKGDVPLEKEVSKARSKTSINDTSTIPNGGLLAWLQVAGSFMMFFNTWGILNTFGAYQTYYETGKLFHASSSTISWIGSIQAFFGLFMGCVTGPVYDAGHVHFLMWTGSFLIVFGQMMLSLCTTFWQALLAQAFCMGIGVGTLFIPGVAIMSTYFTTRLATAIGIAAAGSSLGGIIYPIVFHRLLDQIGFGWSTRVLGFIMLATLAFPLMVMRVRVLPPHKRKLFDPSAFKEPVYVLWVIGGLLGFMGLYVPFFYIQYFAITTHITTPYLGFYLLAILNAGSVFGRIVPGILADRIGSLNMIVPCAMLTGTLTLILIGVHTLPGVVIIALLYGFFSGTFVSIPASVFVQITKNRALIGTRMGQGFAVIGIGALIGTPIAGAVLNARGFTGLWAFGGAFTIGGGLFMLWARMLQANWKFTVKV